MRGPVLARHKVGQIPTGELTVVVTEHASQGRVGGFDVAGSGGGDDPVLGTVDNGLHAQCRSAQFAFGMHTIDDPSELNTDDMSRFHQGTVGLVPSLTEELEHPDDSRTAQQRNRERRNDAEGRRLPVAREIGVARDVLDPDGYFLFVDTPGQAFTRSESRAAGYLAQRIERAGLIDIPSLGGLKYRIAIEGTCKVTVTGLPARVLAQHGQCVAYDALDRIGLVSGDRDRFLQLERAVRPGWRGCVW